MNHYYFDKNTNSTSLIDKNTFLYLERQGNGNFYRIKATTKEKFDLLKKLKHQYLVDPNKIFSLPADFFEQQILRNEVSFDIIKKNVTLLDKYTLPPLKYEDLIQLELCPISKDTILYLSQPKEKEDSFILRALRKEDFMRLKEDPSTKATTYWPIELSQLEKQWLNEKIVPNFTLSNGSYTKKEAQEYFNIDFNNTKPQSFPLSSSKTNSSRTFLLSAGRFFDLQQERAAMLNQQRITRRMQAEEIVPAISRPYIIRMFPLFNPTATNNDSSDALYNNISLTFDREF